MKWTWRRTGRNDHHDPYDCSMKWTRWRKQYEIRMLTNVPRNEHAEERVRNEHADDYNTILECWRIQYETRVWNAWQLHNNKTVSSWGLSNLFVAWNEDADECSMKWTCWRIQYEMNMLTNTAWNEHDDECSMKWTWWRTDSMKWKCWRIQYEWTYRRFEYALAPNPFHFKQVMWDLYYVIYNNWP